MNKQWLDEFVTQTAPQIEEPYLLCLAAAIAAVESGWGRHVIHGPGGQSGKGEQGGQGGQSGRDGQGDQDSQGGKGGQSGQGGQGGQDGQANMLNEIGYKAVPGKPSTTARTQEADGPGGQLQTHTGVAFRLFADRAEQARSLLYLMRTSAYFEASRLLHTLTFYAAYAPGRTAGAKELLNVFNTLAQTGQFPGIKPFNLPTPTRLDTETQALNHTAARQAVRMFGEITGEDGPKL